MSHPVMWFEVLGANGGKLRKFYGDLFGWKFEVIPQIDYGIVKSNERGIPGWIASATRRSASASSRSPAVPFEICSRDTGPRP